MALMKVETSSVGEILINPDDITLVQPVDGNRLDVVMRDGGRFTVRGTLSEFQMRVLTS